MDTIVDHTSMTPNDKTVDLALAVDVSGCNDICVNLLSAVVNSAREALSQSGQSEVRVALVECGGHQSTDDKFRGRVLDFTAPNAGLEQWLSKDVPSSRGFESRNVVNAIHDVHALNWGSGSLKICIFISALSANETFPQMGVFQGDSTKVNDLIRVSLRLVEKGITLYAAGCEPAVRPVAGLLAVMACVTGGQYVGVSHTGRLAEAVVGIAQEELALRRLRSEVDLEVQAELDSEEEIVEEELCALIHTKMLSKGTKTLQLQSRNAELDPSVFPSIVKALISIGRMKGNPDYVLESLGLFTSGSEPYEDDDSEDEVVDYTGGLIEEFAQVDLMGNDTGLAKDGIELTEGDISYSQSCRLVIQSFARKIKCN